MTLQTTGQMTIKNIADEFGCANNLDDCAVAAGLSASNIVLPTSFYGLSAWSATISPATGTDSATQSNTCEAVFVVSTDGGDAPFTYLWVVTGIAGVHSGQGTNTLTIRASTPTVTTLVGNVTCTVNGDKEASASYSFSWTSSGNGGGPVF
jgi:hypothetical protein